VGITFFHRTMVKSAGKSRSLFKRRSAEGSRKRAVGSRKGMGSPTNLKNNLRQRILNILRSQKKEDILKKSKIIQEKLFAREEFQKAKVILFYASFDGEVETLEMMKQAQKLGKKIALPMILKEKKKLIPALIEDFDTLVKGAYGICCPARESSCILDVEEIDLAIVPGVAFDKNNNRLGRGQGYYDRFLSELSDTIPTIGLAFDFQLVEKLPQQQKHDVPVKKVITN